MDKQLAISSASQDDATVSVVITTHNRIKYLLEAISSVIAQTYRNIELIVVDDASDDETQTTLSNPSYDELLTYIRIDKSEGGNHARNVGILRSSGKYIALLDDDDTWEPTKIEKQVRLIEHDEEVGLVYCGMTKFANGGERIPDDLSKLMRGDLSTYSLIKKVCLNSTILFRSEMARNGCLFDEKVRYWQEYEFVIRVAQEWLIDFVPESLVNYRLSQGSAPGGSLTNKTSGWDDAVQYIFEKHRALYDALSKRERADRDLYYYLEGYSRYKNAGDLRGAMRYFFKIVGHPAVVRAASGKAFTRMRNSLSRHSGIAAEGARR